MRRLGFLLTRRWVIFFVVVLALAWLAWRLGEWQFDRLDERQQRNAIIERNTGLSPVPVTEVMSPEEPVAEPDQWRVVTATGQYVEDETVIVRYRTRNGASGVDVVVPLALAGGRSVLVDRGWFATDNQGVSEVEVPSPPDGTVTVTGWVRADATGDHTSVTDRSTRAVSSDRIEEALGRDLLDGFVDLSTEDPPPAQALAPVEMPELDDGPHFFYGLQWWFFAALAIVGFCWLAWDEYRGKPRQRRGGSRQSARSMPPSTGSMTPDTKDAAGERTKAATRPNSSGSP